MLDDVLSDVLKLANIQSVLVGGFSAGGIWGVRFAPPEALKFFVLVKGHCWLITQSQAPVRIEAGDVLVLSTSASYVLASSPEVEPVEASGLFSGTVKTAQLGEGEDCVQLGGHVLLSPSSGWRLADVLPTIIHVRSACAESTTLRWLLEQLIREQTAQLPGGKLATSQIALLMFLQILRIHLDEPACATLGWLRVVTDPYLAPAVRLLHARPEHPWGLETLAKEAGMSRTAFAVRFKSVAGVAPLTYLCQWRMHLAERALREESVSISALASRLGYGSDSAFSTAFKRLVGLSPFNYMRRLGDG